MSLFSAGLFGPDIPDSENLHMQYDSKDISATDGDAISSWPDSSGNTNDLSGGSGIYRASAFNGSEPAVEFVRSNNHGDFAVSGLHATLSAPQTVYVVYQDDEAGGSDNANAYSAEGVRDVAFIDNNGGDDEDALQSNGGNESIDGPASETVEHIAASVYDGGSSLFERDDSSGTTGSVTDTSISSFEIAPNNIDGWDGLIAAVYVYDAAHGSSTRSDVFSYLSNRFGF